MIHPHPFLPKRSSRKLAAICSAGVMTFIYEVTLVPLAFFLLRLKVMVLQSGSSFFLHYNLFELGGTLFGFALLMLVPLVVFSWLSPGFVRQAPLGLVFFYLSWVTGFLFLLCGLSLA